MMRKSRPGSVIVVGWVTIITGIFTFLYAFSLHGEYKSSAANYGAASLFVIITIVFIVSVIYLTCGIAILCGKNWGRVSYIILVGFITLFSMVSNNFSIIYVPYLILYLMFLYLLLRPEANKFFKKIKKDQYIL